MGSEPVQAPERRSGLALAARDGVDALLDGRRLSGRQQSAQVLHEIAEAGHFWYWLSCSADVIAQEAQADPRGLERSWLIATGLDAAGKATRSPQLAARIVADVLRPHVHLEVDDLTRMALNYAKKQIAERKAVRQLRAEGIVLGSSRGALTQRPTRPEGPSQDGRSR